jgi:porphobilinogen synthase
MAIKFGRPLEANMRFSPAEIKSVPTHPTTSPLDLTTRPRRNRQSEWIRRMVRENVLTADDLIWPLFLIDGESKRVPVAAMPGV